MRNRDEHVEELLDQYRTGELDAAQGRGVEEHLVSCGECRSALAALDAFSDTVARAYAAETSARALGREPDWGRLRAAIVARTAAPQGAPRRSWLARHAPQAALTALAFVAVGVLWQQGIREPADAGRALRDERPSTAADPAVPPEEDLGVRSGIGEVEEGDEATAVGEPGLAGLAGRDDGAETDARPPIDARERVEREAVRPEAPPDRLEAPPDGRRHDAALGAQDRVAAAGVPEERAEARAEVAEDADGEEPLAQAGQVAMKVDSAAPANELERFRTRARTALAEGDPVLAETALTQWEDSLAPDEDLPGDLRRAAEALADSLAEFLATRP